MSLTTDNKAEIIFESNCPCHTTITPITYPRVFRLTVTFKLDHSHGMKNQDKLSNNEALLWSINEVLYFNYLLVR